MRRLSRVESIKYGGAFRLIIHVPHAHTCSTTRLQDTRKIHSHTSTHAAYTQARHVLHARVSIGAARSSEANSSRCKLDGELVGQAARVSVWVHVLEPLAPLTEA